MKNKQNPPKNKIADPSSDILCKKLQHKIDTLNYDNFVLNKKNKDLTSKIENLNIEMNSLNQNNKTEVMILNEQLDTANFNLKQKNEEIEKLKEIIKNQELNIDEFRAFTLINKYSPLIFINTNDTNNGKIFSLLHELTHIWLGNDNLYNDSHAGSNKVSKLEQLCNEVAAEILVPNKLFINKWKENEEISIDKIKNIAQYFKCSSFVIARRALNEKFISKQFYNEFIEEKKKEYAFYKKRTSGNSGGGNFYSTLISHWDRKFIFALDNSTKSGRTQYLDAYRLVQMKGKTFHKLVDELKNKAGGDIE